MRLRSYSGDKFFHYSRATAQAMPAHLWLGRIRLVALEFMGLLDLSADNNGHVYIDHNALGRVQFARKMRPTAPSLTRLPRCFQATLLGSWRPRLQWPVVALQRR